LGRSRSGRDAQELQSVPQQFPEDRKAGAKVTLPNASYRHGTLAEDVGGFAFEVGVVAGHVAFETVSPSLIRSNA